LAHFALHHIDQGRKSRVLSEELDLPEFCAAEGIETENLSHLFQEDSIWHSSPPVDADQDLT
jgi:hypothetical protein